jgi:hypothetical protein
MVFNGIFLWNSNLEFTFDPKENILSNKVLYRSFWDKSEFKKSIYQHIYKKNLNQALQSYIDMIFSIPEVQNLLFHFWEDISTWRTKFYISLYEVPFRKSLRIISQVKKILGIQQYVLDKNFQAFDCLWFDISESWIILKVYELLFHEEKYMEVLPDYIMRNNVKKVGLLKSGNRRKVFFRLIEPIDMSPMFWYIYSHMSELEKSLPKEYKLQKRISYFCVENDKQEIYFI